MPIDLQPERRHADYRGVRRLSRVLTGALAVLVLLPATAMATGTPTPQATIFSSGSGLSKVVVGNELSCQVQRGTAYQIFPNDSAPGDCGTIVQDGIHTYGPDFPHHDSTLVTGSGLTPTAYVPVSQSAATGSGTIADPYKIVTVVNAGTRLRITETDSYVTGDLWWTTDVAVRNLADTVVATTIDRGMDCYLGSDDEGYGFKDAASGGGGCAENANNHPAGLVEAIIPAPGHTVHFSEGAFSTNWSTIASRLVLADTCACTTSIDNGTSVQWALSLSAQETQVVSFATVFDPDGGVPTPPPALVPPAPTSTPTVDTVAVPTTGLPIPMTPGTWDDSTATQTYQWQRCPLSATTCTDIPGATDETYTPVSDDIGDHLRVVQTATNDDGAADTTSGLTPAVVAGVAPAGLTAPVAGTAPTHGTVLHGTAGTWTGATSTAVLWQSCTTTSTSSCTDIPSATTLDYTPTAGDVGTFLRIVETATNSDGDTERASAFTDAVAGLPPVGDTPPSLSTSGAAQEGHAVSGDQGTWTDAVSYAFQYQRCTSSTDPLTCTDIPDAIALDYTPTADDAGRSLRLVVTATNPWGSTAAGSALGDQVLPAPPAVVVAPGTGGGTTTAPLDQQPADVGTALQPDLGSFHGATDVTYQYQRCATADESSCVDIAGATDATYVPGNEDVGFHVRLVVQATNAGGTVTVATPMTRTIAARPVLPSPEAPGAAFTTPVASAPAPAPPAVAAPVAVRTACISRRSVTLHWIVPKGQRVASYTVTLNGKRSGKLPGRRAGTTIHLNGRPAQVVTVVVTARTRSGQNLSTTRRYQTCGGQLAGLPLATLRLTRAG